MGKIKLVNHCTFIAKHLHILRALSCVSQVLANNSGKKKNNTSDSRSSDNNFKDISYYFLTAHNTEETNHVLYKGYFFFKKLTLTLQIEYYFIFNRSLIPVTISLAIK